MALDNSAFQRICVTVQAVIDDGVRLQHDAATVALDFWTAAHGVAAMLIAKPHLPFGDAEAFADRGVVFRRLWARGDRFGRSARTPQQGVAGAIAHQPSEGSWIGRGPRCRRSITHFSHVWPVAVNHESRAVRTLRRENLVGLSGRVLEVGAGIGTNFALYPESVEQVVAIEPEPHMAERARAAAAVAPVPVQVIGETAEEFSGGEQFDAVVCSLVLCSVRDPEGVLRHLGSLLRPGGQLRYLEHVASDGARGRLQRFADATVWPKLLGNCHTHRDTERSIVDAGFEVDTSRREWTLPFWTIRPVVSELALGRARKP